MWLWLYVPAELLSFAVAATATLQIVQEIVGRLWRPAPVSMTVVRDAAGAIACAVAGLVVAALLEQVAIGQAW